MSIKQLEEIKDDYHKRVGGTTIKYEDLYIKQFMRETITTFKTQSDMIADLGQQLAKKMKELEQKQSYYPAKEEIPYIKIGLTD